jgi:enamine deaminase RidA (YjgF/YER057c/UK114 family)
MTHVTPFGVDYLTLDPLTGCRASDWHDVLGVIRYAADAALPELTGVPVLQVGTRPLVESAAIFEVWRAAGALDSGQVGQVRYRASRDLVFGCVSIDESGAAEPGNQALQQATMRAYAAIFACLDALRLGPPLRIWNYLSDINLVVDGVERYRIFNEARQRAFQSAHCGVRGNVPAACALGTPAGGPLAVYFIAGRGAGTAVENPRQVPAYDYPAVYGTFSPSFSRATIANRVTGHMLFISGTASILGHRTVHVGDVVAQTRETLHNIRAVVDEANRVAGAGLYAAERLKYKVYLRRPQDIAAVASECAALMGDCPPPLYLHADICRADLLVEIEAVGVAAQP